MTVRIGDTMRLRNVLCVVTLVTFTASRAGAAPPSTAPTIIEVEIEDPLNGEAKSFLDLDSGKTFSFANYHRESFIRESGADIMCETREPTEGFAAHGLTLLAIQTPFDQPPPYNEIVNQLSKVQKAHFAMFPVKSFPGTYLFRTQGGTHGVLEISERSQNEAGLRLRYQIVNRPVMKLGPVVRGRMPIGVRVQQAQAGLFRLKQRLPADHPNVRASKLQLEFLQQLAMLEAAEVGLKFIGVQPEKIAAAIQMEVRRRGGSPEMRTIAIQQERQMTVDLRNREAMEREFRIIRARREAAPATTRASRVR